MTVAKFTIDVTLLEDMHTGSGLGGADVDALLARDRRGQPMVRWSHLRGLLKQALIDRGAALATNVDSQVLALFGRSHLDPAVTPERGAIHGRSLRLVQGSADDSIVWGATARVPGTRVPKTDTLRRIEYVRAGARFQGELRVPCRDGWPELTAKLLQRVNRIGAGRSRGAGLVSVAATKATIEAPRFTAGATGTTIPAAHRLLFEALDPISLAATGSPGNLIRGHSHLSAAAVCGMLVRWALAMGQNDLADLLLNHRIVCGPAYPVPPHALACGIGAIDVVPFPLSLQAPKPAAQNNALPWWAGDPGRDAWVDTLSVQSQARDQSEKLKRPDPHDYLVRIGQAWERFRCTPGEAMRNDAGSSQRAAKKQELFAQEQVAEGTGFVTRIVALDSDAESLLDQFITCLLNGGHWLQAGRGGAPLAVVGHTVAAENPHDKPDPIAVRLLVESEVILRADDLGFRTRLDRAAVLHLLRLAGARADWLEHLKDAPDSMEVKDVSEPAEVRGRNIATGGPRLPALAIRRGSEAVLRFACSEAAETCRALLRSASDHGLGERRAEGLGRLRIDFAPACASAGSAPAGSTATAPPDPVSLNPGEALLETAAQWLDANDFPRGFTASRWQALRNAARAPGKKALKTSLNAWRTQAEREAARLAQRGGARPQDGGAAWLGRLAQALPENLDARRSLLRTIGLLAAKQAAGSRDKQQRTGDEAAAVAGAGAGAGDAQ